MEKMKEAVQVELEGSAECRHCRSLFAAYQENQLSSAQKADVQNHLASCEKCRQLWSDLQTLHKELLRSLPLARPHLTPGASGRIQQAVYQRIQRALFWQKAWHLTEQLGTLILLCLVAYSIWLVAGQLPQSITPPELFPQPTFQDQLPATSSPTELAQANQLPTTNRQLPEGLNLSPSQLAQTVVDAALQGDQAALLRAYNHLNPTHQEAALRMWAYIQPCGNSWHADQFRYEIMPQKPNTVIRVDIVQEGHYLGELKMRWLEGDWRIFFTRYPTRPALGGC